MLYIKNKFYKILIVLMSVICVFYNTSVSYVKAESSYKPHYETSKIENDLVEIFGVEDFSEFLSCYPNFKISKEVKTEEIVDGEKIEKISIEEGIINIKKDENTVSVISFLEHGFDKNSSNSLYSLFLYVCCPSKTEIVKNSYLNYIQMGFTTDSKKVLSVDYEKLRISFIDEVLIESDKSVISKWKININESKVLSPYINNYVQLSNRIYCLSGIEFLLSGEINAKEYVVGDSYHVVDETNAKGEITTTVTRSSLESVEVETKHTFYRTGYSEIDTSNNSGWQTQISSCYFALPKFLEKKYGLLTSMKVSFENKFLAPMLIVPDEETKKAFEIFKYELAAELKAEDSDLELPSFHTPITEQSNGGGSGTNTRIFCDIYFNPPPLIMGRYRIDYKGGNTSYFLDNILVDENLKYQDFEDMSTYYFDKQNIYDFIKENYDKEMHTGDTINYPFKNLGESFPSMKVDKDLYDYFVGYYTDNDNIPPGINDNNEGLSDYEYFYVACRLYNRLSNGYIFETTPNLEYEQQNVNGNKPFNKLSFEYNQTIEKTYSISNTDTVSNAIKSLEFGELDNGFDFGNLFESLWKIIVSGFTDTRPHVSKEIKPIVKVNSTDFYMDNDDFADKYCVDKNEVPALKNYALQQNLAENDVYLLRYDLCEYYSSPVDIQLSADKSTKGFVARQSAYLNFDVIQFGYGQDGVIIPAIHSPVDVFNSITGQQNVDLTIFYGFLGLLLAFVILVLLCAFCPSIIGPLFKIIWYAVTAPFKVVFTLIKLIFKAIIRNKYNE